jgi:protein-tyrosine phosphatase
MGIACGHHRARQMTRADYDAFDLIIGMDAENLDGMYRILMGEMGYGWSWRPVSAAEAAKADPEGKVHLLLDWSKHPRDIADPWYTHDFDTTFADVREGCEALLNAIQDGAALPDAK